MENGICDNWWKFQQLFINSRIGNEVLEIFRKSALSNVTACDKKIRLFSRILPKEEFHMLSRVVIRSRNNEFMVNNEFLSPWKSTLSWFYTFYSRLIRRGSKTRSNRYGNLRDFHKTITPSFRCVYRSR